MKRETPSMDFHVTLLDTLTIYQIKNNKSIGYWGSMKNQKIQICPVCNRATEIVWVNSHCQCGFCKNNIDPCCSGETVQHENKDDTKKT